jgi:4-diphosphocytidyl-2-C-methyl-D-erythritol kinase
VVGEIGCVLRTHYHRRVSESVRSVSVDVPAKINLLLRVGPRRADGYHDLVTVFHAVSLFDRITAEPWNELSVSLHGPESEGLPIGPGNLAWRAAEGLAAATGRGPSVRISIDKAIPVAAGLAGGSADAAGTLVACARLWNSRAETVLGVAAELGSDVPFALRGGTALGTGRGEILTSVQVAAPLHWVIAAASYPLSTPAVYAELDRIHPRAAFPGPADAGPMLAALAAADLGAADLDRVAAALGNDLQQAAVSLAPDLAATLRAGSEAGALAGLVSGSGPSCAFLAANAGDAVLISDAVTASGTCRYAVPVRGGVPGPMTTQPWQGEPDESY